MRRVSALWLFVIACGPDPRDEESCTDGTSRCTGGAYEVCSGGEFVVAEHCPLACSDAVGCVDCVVGTASCDGDVAHVCGPGGVYDQYCDPVQGLSCDADGGGCVGACAPGNLGSSYIGCEYYPTITGNMVSNAYSFAVVVSNTTSQPARVTIEGGALAAPDVFEVGAGGVAVRRLPWRDDLKLCSAPQWSMCVALPNTSVFATGGAYRLRSTQPVTVYQFNPLDYFTPTAPEHSYTNDASLLFPTNAWRHDYLVVGWGGMTTNPTLIGITAALDDTDVTIAATAPVKAEAGAPGIVPGTPTKVTLSRGDVLQLGAAMVEFTGTRITASRPIQVISAHYCANIPNFFGDCDHIEESMLPLAALGARYIITAPAVPSLPEGKEQLVRIVATADNTTLTFDPPQAGVPTTIARAGDWIEIPRRVASYAITADRQILVAQYMLGQHVAGGTGDPSMALAVPVEQFRSVYQFHAPTNYEVNYVDIVAPMGAAISLDGAPAGPITNIGATGWGMIRVHALGPGPGLDGNHTITGDRPFGITVYGYGEYTSYWYAGGLDLKDVVL